MTFIHASLCFLVLMSLSQGADGSKGTLSKEEQELFRWYDQLGFPDVSKLPFITVSTGAWSQSGNDPPKKYPDVPAFLIKEELKSFEVFDIHDLAIRKYERTSPKAPDYEKVGFINTDIKVGATQYLKQIRQGDSRRIDLYARGRLGRTGTFVIMARACASYQLNELARELLDEAKAEDKNDTVRSLRTAVAEAFAHTLMWQAIIDVGNVHLKRDKLLKQFKRIVKDYPGTPHHDRATQIASILEKMVTEDKQHVAPANPWASLTKKEQAAALIFRLRDQHGVQWSQPGSCDIFSQDRMGEKSTPQSPALQLVELGYDAVPLLIEAIEDQRLTRSVGFWRDFTFSHHVLTVGDCAVTILGRIAGKDFHDRTNRRDKTDAECKADSKRLALVWWTEFERKGEKQFLIDAISVGQEDSPIQARKFLEKYPDKLLTVIDQGIKNAKEPSVQARLVGIAAQLKGDGVLTLLDSALRNQHRDIRVVAAAGLLVHGNEYGVLAMIKEWESGPSSSTKDNEQDYGLLIDFLTATGRLDAIKAMGANMKRWPIGVRRQIIESLSDRGPSWSQMRLNSDKEIDWSSFQKSKRSREVTDAIETLLVSALDDTEQCSGLHYNGVSNPAIADFSAEALARQWNKPEQYDMAGTFFQRETQRTHLKNVWLAKHGRPTVALPSRPMVNPVSEKQIVPLLKPIIDNETPKQRLEATVRILTLGLPALPVVRSTWSRLATDHPAYSEMKSLTIQLATVVREVTFDRNSAAPTKAFKERIDKLVGKPLNGNEFMTIFLDFLKELPPGVTGIRFMIDREGDDTGITIKIALTKMKQSQAGTQKGWATAHELQIGKSSMGSSSGMSSKDHGLTPEAWTDFRESLQRCLTAHPKESLQIRLSCIEEGD